MAKRKKEAGEFGIIMIIILMIITCSEFTAIYLLAQRAARIMMDNVSWGVYISGFLLLIYCYLMGSSIFFILKKRKKAVEMTIGALIAGLVFSLWYDVIGKIIFYGSEFSLVRGLVNLAANVILTLAIALYLKKSKRVKKVFVR